MKLKNVALAAALASASAAHALPSGFTGVTPGVTASLVSSTQLDISNAASGGRGIATFGSFNIAPGEVVNVIQAPSSSFLARINDANPTSIFGSLNSAGNVFLINPNGLIFGAGSVINVGGLVASTLPVSDSSFLAGNVSPMSFLANATAGKIEVQSGASINAANGGFVHLVATEIQNSGNIQARNGIVSLTAAHNVTITEGAGTAPVVTADARDASPQAEGFAGAVTSGSIFNTGTVSATTAVSEGGKIYLRAVNSVSNGGSINAGSLTSSEAYLQSGAGDIALTGGDVTSKTVKLNGGVNISQTGGLVKADSFYANAGGSIDMPSLTNITGIIEQATANGAVTLKGTGNMTVNGSVNAGTGSAFVYTDAGNLTISSTGSVSGYNGAYLATPGVFTNNGGASAVNGGLGRFIIYSNNVTADNIGGLAGSNLYGRTYTGHEPTSADMTAHSGNLFVHIVSPTLTLSAVSDTKIYGAADPGTVGTFTNSGLVGGDTIGYAVTGSFTREAGSHVGLGSCAGGAYCINGTFASDAGYSIVVNNGTLNITPVSLTASLANTGITKVYDGTTAAPSGFNPVYNVTGFVTGDTAAALNTGSLVYDSAHVAAATTLTASGLSIASITGANGSLASDYQLSATTASAGANITTAALTATLNNTGVTKVVDGTTAAPAGFTPTYTISGLVAGDTSATITNTGSSYGSAAVGAGTLTTNGLALAGIAGSNGSLTSDYALSNTSSSVAATITAAPVTPPPPAPPVVTQPVAGSDDVHIILSRLEDQDRGDSRHHISEEIGRDHNGRDGDSIKHFNGGRECRK